MADEIVKVIKIEAQDSEQSVRQLRAEIASLRDALLNTEQGSEEYNKTVEKLVSEQKKLNDVMSAGKDAFRTNKQELAALRNELDQLVPGTKEYAVAFQKAADMTHTLRERQEMLKYSAADLGTQLDNVRAIGAGLAGGFNAIQGVLALTGSKSEELQETMMKLQAGIAIVQGLQGLEGMGKRLKGVVDGLTAMIFKTNETTTAVAAETTAVGANTAAQEANTVATAGATVATKAFQKALVATGIGAIIVLIGSLIAHWEDFKDMVGLSNEKLEQFQGIMDKVKAVLGGVANVIMNAFVASVKNAITAISTLGEVTKNVLTFQFGKAADAAKEGWAKIAENTKKGLSIVQNYQEGAAKTAAKIQEKRTAEALKKSAEELNETIKDNEAKYGSDWKYTQDGKKLYDQYFDTKLKAYKKDSKEYKDLMRQKWAYDREYQKHLDDASKASGTGSGTKAKASVEDRTAEQELGNIERIQKRAEDAAKDELQLLKDKYEEEKALFEKYEKDTTALTAEYEAKRDAIQKKYDDAEKKRKSDNLKETSDKALGDLDYKNGQDLTNIELEYSWKEAKNGALSYDEIIEEHNKIYAANKEYLEKSADEYKKIMESEDATDQQREDAKRKYYETQDQLRDLNKQKEIQDAEDRRDRINAEIDMYRQLGDAIADIFGSIADIMEDEIKREVEAGDISEEEGKRRFEAVKRLQIAQATIQMLAGIATALAGAFTTKTGPWDMVLAGAQAATIAASGIAQIVKIKNTQLGGGGSSVGSPTAAPVQTAPEEYVPQYTQNATGESEITRLADSIHNQKVVVLESDITDAQNRRKVRVAESSW